jgi:glycine oxidase
MISRVVVLGRGVAGLTLAWELARRGEAPLVVGGARPAASEVAAGMLSPGPEMDSVPALGRLGAESLREYPRFLAALADDGNADIGYRQSGVLRLGYSEEQVERLREGVGLYEAAGLPTRWLDARACLAEAPGLGGEDLRGGLLSYDEGQVQPRWMLAALEEAVRRRGGEFREAEVVQVHTRPGTPVVELGGGETIHAAQVVLALGSWTALLPTLGYLVRPVKGQLLRFAGVAGPGRMLYWGQNYLLSKPDGTVVLGATMEEAGFSLDATSGAQELRGLLARVWPSLSGARAEVRVGLRPAAPDSLPVIGPLPELPGAYVFTAHHRNGFLLAPFSARLAATEILDGSRQAPLARLRPERLRARSAALGNAG